MKTYEDITQEINRVENLINMNSFKNTLAIDQITKLYFFRNKDKINQILRNEGFMHTRMEKNYTVFKNEFAKIMLWNDKINIFRA